MSHGQPVDGSHVRGRDAGAERACRRGLHRARGELGICGSAAMLSVVCLCLSPLVAVAFPGALLSPQLRAVSHRFGAVPGLRREKWPGVVCSGGPPSWVPWPGSNRPIIETERDILLKREKCKLCSGSGKTACRRCSGKGYVSGSSRPLRFANETVSKHERVVTDSTGLVRAVEVTQCDCMGSGLSECMLCCGTGKRLDDDPFSEEGRINARRRIGLDDNDDDKGDDVHRYTGGRR